MLPRVLAQTLKIALMDKSYKWQVHSIDQKNVKTWTRLSEKDIKLWLAAGRNNSDDFTVVFDTGERSVSVKFKLWLGEKTKGYPISTDISFTTSQHRPDVSGDDSPRIFATILDIVAWVLKNLDVPRWQFYTEKPSVTEWGGKRTRIYTQMAKRHLGRVPGWKIDISESGPFQVFVLERK